MLELAGNYVLELKINDIPLPIIPQMIEQLTITLDIDRVVPTFRLGLRDVTGILPDLIPYDENSGKITIGFARIEAGGSAPDNINEFKFNVKRRVTNTDKLYEVEGLLDVKKLFRPVVTKAYIGSIKSSLESISKSELEISETEVGASLDYEKTVLQTNWSNVDLLVYLSDNLIGKSGEGCYYCFVKNVLGKQVFVFKSLNELLLSSIKYKFIVGPYPLVDVYPILDYRIADDSSLLTEFGAQEQNWGYFNYEVGEYKEEQLDISDYPSLTQQLLVNKADSAQSKKMISFGRSNMFTSDFEGRVKGIFYNKATKFVSMWAATWGLENISPGDIVSVFFSEALLQNKMSSYQHAGNWMVKRVVHIIGATFMTNLFLVRCGVDTDVENSLLEGKEVRND